MKYLSLAAAILLSSCTLFKAQLPADTPKKKSVVAETLASTVGLKYSGDDRFFCAGALVRSVVITAKHCVDRPPTKENAVLVGVWPVAEHVEVELELLYETADHDLAILRPSKIELPESRPLAPEPPKWGHKVAVVGHPLGLAWTITSGIVSHPRRVGGAAGNSHVWLQIDANAAGGSSGGPVFNQYGEVVGIVSFTVYGYPFLVGATHWEVIKDSLDKVYSGPKGKIKGNI